MTTKIEAQTLLAGIQAALKTTPTHAPAPCNERHGEAAACGTESECGWGGGGGGLRD